MHSCDGCCSILSRYYPLTLPSPPKGGEGYIWLVLTRTPGDADGWFVKCYLLKLVINEISGMKSEMTMNPTATPRNTISNGSISLVKPSVMTRTSSS